MGVRGAHVSLAGARPGPWSLGALALSAVGVLAATWVIVGSDGDPSQVRWPLVVAPVAVCLVPILVPRKGARIGAAGALAGWCALAALSIGFTQLPALLAALLAAVSEER
jgi:hypothetical protein